VDWNDWFPVSHSRWSEDASGVIVSFNGSNRHEIIFIFPLFLFSNSCKEKLASGALELTKKAKLERFKCHFLWEWWLPLPSSCKVLSSLCMIDNSSFDTYMILTELCVLVFKKLPQQNHRHLLGYAYGKMSWESWTMEWEWTVCIILSKQDWNKGRKILTFQCTILHMSVTYCSECKWMSKKPCSEKSRRRNKKQVL
jgi:hypothetical protein